MAVREARTSVDLAAIKAPTPVNVEVRVKSANDVTSPVTGARAAAFVIEIGSLNLEASERSMSRSPTFEAVGSVVVGDRVELAHEGSDGAIVAVLRRMKLLFRAEATAGHAITTAPPELVPLLGKVRFGRTACFCEHAISRGDRMRLRAVVERSEIVIPGAHGSERRAVLIVRDDLGPAQLEALFETTF